MFRKKIAYLILALIAGSLIVILLRNLSLPAPTNSNPDLQSAIITTNQKPEIRLATKNHTATMTLMNASATNAIKKNNQITFPDIHPYTDAVYTQVKNGIKEDIILHQSPTKPVSYTFSINPEGLKPQFFQGQYYFFDQNGYAQLTIPKPFMIDAAGVRSEVVSVELTRTGSTYKSVIIPDYDWLTSTQRKYPVTIDPSLMVPDSPLRELADRRTISAKTYDLGNGKFAATSGLEAIHYQDETGKWQDTHTAIVPSTDPEYDYMNLTNNFHTYFSTDGFGNKQAVKFEVGDAWMKFRLANNATGSGQLNPTTDNVFTYQNVYQQADKVMDAAYTLSDTQLLEEIILNQFQGSPDISQEIELHNAYFQPDGNRINAYRQGTNELLWIIPAPVMYEVNNPEIKNYGLHYGIKPLGENKLLLTKVIDPEGETWLADPIRNYPLVIDTTAGPNSPGTMSNVGGFSNPDNAKVSDDTSAQQNAMAICPSCLSGDTTISTPHDDTAISNLKVGDLVYSFNEISKTIEPKPIIAIHKNPVTNTTKQYYRLYFSTFKNWSSQLIESTKYSDFNLNKHHNFFSPLNEALLSNSIRATSDHPFYVGNKVVQTSDLHVGDTLTQIDGQLAIITRINAETNYDDYVWNLTIAENHNFFANGILTHNARDYFAKIVKGGTPGTTNKADPNTWGTAYAYTTYGSNTELWGETWSYSDINSSQFGFTISAWFCPLPGGLTATNFGFNLPDTSEISGIVVEVRKMQSGTGGRYANVDHIRMTVYYTESEPTPLPVTKFDGVNLNGVSLNQ